MKLNKTCAVVLAAGNGKRMQSGKPKVFCEVLFKPLIGWVLQNCKDANILDICLVCSEDGLFKFKELFGSTIEYVLQDQKLGTAHAVLQAGNFLKTSQSDDVLILLGDVPFLDSKTIEESYIKHKQEDNQATVIAATLDDPFGYGRIDEMDGKVTIVEEKDATDAQRAIRKVNSGAIWFDIKALLGVLEKVDNNNANKEYYITTAVNILKRTGCYVAQDDRIILGANTNQQLFKLNEVARNRIISQKIEQGVEFIVKDGVVISPDVTIGKGTLIFPNVTIKGHCSIGANCIITSGSFIKDSNIGNNCEIKSSYILNSELKNNVRVGPFAQIRPGSSIADYVKIGNFVEVKNSSVDTKTSIAHLTYIGDSNIGARVNFGCGCTTANYDGEKKHRTTVADDAFVGCNVSLIAPVNIGERAFIAAGSVITNDVLADDFAIARAKQITKTKYMQKKKKEKKNG